jgi:hypothetical protein
MMAANVMTSVAEPLHLDTAPATPMAPTTLLYTKPIFLKQAKGLGQYFLMILNRKSKKLF